VRPHQRTPEELERVIEEKAAKSTATDAGKEVTHTKI
jgi:hypothetical protein